MIPKIILASTSRYRAQLLSRIVPDFETDNPQIDETALEGETPEALCLRLAKAKALAVFERHPSNIVIGSDQVAVLGNRILGKPGTQEKALSQLLSMSGQKMRFLTAVAVVCSNHPIEAEIVETVVTMRKLSEAQILHYLKVDQPFDCAGAAKIESLGIALTQSVESTDPTALIGLPLITVTRFLHNAGFDVFQ